jgi:hypothetical protein
MSGMLKSIIRAMWSLRRSLRRFSRAISSWSPVGSAQSARMRWSSWLGLERFEPWARLIVTHRFVILLRIRVWSKPGTSGDLGAPAAERFKASRQSARFVIYYGSVTLAE